MFTSTCPKENVTCYSSFIISLLTRYSLLVAKRKVLEPSIIVLLQDTVGMDDTYPML